MTHEQLVEEVARAIYAKRDPLNSDPWDAAMARKATMGRTDTPMIAEAADAARAAIATIAEALRVPSDDMTIAGGKQIAPLTSKAKGQDFWNANACWRAMLAASPLGKEDKQ